MLVPTAPSQAPRPHWRAETVASLVSHVLQASHISSNFISTWGRTSVLLEKRQLIMTFQTKLEFTFEPSAFLLSLFSLLATLTSYSENADRSGKHSDGSRLKLRQTGKSSGGDSFLYRVDENMAASTYSLNKIPERSLEHSASHSAHSIPLYLMPRPNSVAGE